MRRATSTARPVSSAASRSAASSTVSPTSTKPPGSAHFPAKGSLARRIRPTPRSPGITTSTISLGVSGPATSVPPVSLLRPIVLPAARAAQRLPERRYALRGREAPVHQRPGGADAPRAEPQLLREGGGGGDLLRRPSLRLPGVHHHLPRRPCLLRPGQPRPQPRLPRVPRRLHPARRPDRGCKRRSRRGRGCRALRLSSLLRRPQPVHGAPDAPPVLGALGEDLASQARRATGT